MEELIGKKYRVRLLLLLRCRGLTSVFHLVNQQIQSPIVVSDDDTDDTDDMDDNLLNLYDASSTFNRHQGTKTNNVRLSPSAARRTIHHVSSSPDPFLSMAAFLLVGEGPINHNPWI